MTTPIIDFVRRYAEKNGPRMHMPGHKGQAVVGPEALDITEIRGADELYHARGVIRESEENAAALFGSARTLYSAEGSSLCIRAMLYLALLQGKPPVLLAARNAHRVLTTAAALLDIDVRWLYAEESSLLSCPISPAALDAAIRREQPMAVYLTSPDYLGHMQDIPALAAVCHAHGVPLLVDNAHGAYLRFLPQDRHPLSLGADLCCDSAHKTLPCLTGAAYLHVSKNAPAVFAEQAERALSLFASTSPSYLILQSLDAANALLAEDFSRQLADAAARLDGLKGRLADHGYLLAGDEPMKLTIAPKAFGYTGDGLHDLLRGEGIECEFSDPDHLVLMPAPATPAAHWGQVESALLSIPRRAPIPDAPPSLPHPVRACSLRQALLAPQITLPIEDALGRILADAHVGCPPAVPILTAGEVIDQDAANCFRYYGFETCNVIE